MKAQWGIKVPSRQDVLIAQKFTCLGVDGTGCKNPTKKYDLWLTVAIVEETLRGLCKSCFAKLTHKDRTEKATRTVQAKKSQISIEEKLEKNPRHLSNSNEHHTPPYIVEAARKSLEIIDLDPASCIEANEQRIHATEFYHAEDNGFSKEWSGRIFLNPPGGHCDDHGTSVTRQSKAWRCSDDCNHIHNNVVSSQKAWWQKLVSEWEAGHVKSAIFVGFSIEILQTTQVGDFNGYLPLEFPMCFPSRRIAYYKEVETIDNSDPMFAEAGSPPHASVLIFIPDSDGGEIKFGNNMPVNTHRSIQRFLDAFSPIGKVVIPYVWK